MDPKAFSIIKRCIQDDEGGWVFTDRPDDAGGPTYGGMTWKTFDAWQSSFTGIPDWSRAGFIDAAKRDDNALRHDIRNCYHDVFWVKGRCNAVPEFAQQMYFSACVNMGLKEALKCLQTAQRDLVYDKQNQLLADGHWGPKTAEAMIDLQHAVEEENAEYRDDLAKDFKLAFSDAVMHRYIRIVQQNAREWRDAAWNSDSERSPRVLQSENLMGWFNRAISYRSK